MKKNNVTPEEIAFIGDDSNDFELMKLVGFKVTPADGMNFIKEICDYICENRAWLWCIQRAGRINVSISTQTGFW